jgi:hypothetical protein
MLLPLLIAITVILMVGVDLTIVISALLYFVGAKRNGAFRGIQFGFWADVTLLWIFVALSVRLIRSEGAFYLVWMIVCLAASLFLTGLAGWITLRVPWRFSAPLFVILGVYVLGEWLLKYKPLMQ